MDCDMRRQKVLKLARSLMARHGRDFTLVALCKKARISKSQLRKIFSTKAALLSALGEETGPENEADNHTSVVEFNVTHENSEPVDRRFRVLQRAITLLEEKIEAVSAERSRQDLAPEAAGIQVAPAVPLSCGPVIAESVRHDPEAVNQQAQADSALPESFIADEPALPPVIELPPVYAWSDAPSITRDVLDNARALAQTAAEANMRLEKSERKSNMLTFASAMTIVVVGLIVGLASMDGVARATRAPFATASESLANASGVTLINATGAVVADQMTPAVRALTDRAEKGDAGAQADLALAYLRGDGVASNSAAAAGWAGLAAGKGQPLGQFILATLYNGGIKPDPRIGFRWMSAAALNGNVKAMHNVAVALLGGSGVEKNPVEAANWFSKAASMGYRDSAFDLAVLYERGEGVPQSTPRALYWYDRAAAAGDKESAQRASLLRVGGLQTEGHRSN